MVFRPLRTLMRKLLLLLLALGPQAAPVAFARAQSARPAQQKRKSNAAPEKTAREKASKPVARDPAENIRRTTATLLLKSLADEARNFRDPALRARVQAESADALWDSEPSAARALFRRAWEAAVVTDREHERRRDEDAAGQSTARAAAAEHDDIPNLKGEVLRLAAPRDPSLAEEFFNDLEEERKSAAEDESARPGASAADSASTPPGVNPFEAAPALKRRLSLAREFLHADDAARAAQFAALALTRVTHDAVNFLSLLHSRDAALADRHFASLLSLAAADPLADANTVSLLTTYAYTPGHSVIALRDGSSMTGGSGDSYPAPDLSPALRAAFFRTAAQILLRPLAPPEQDRTPAGRYGAYVITFRLLPLFERHAPEHAALLNARLSNLKQELPAHMRSVPENLLDSGFAADAPAAAPETRPAVVEELEEMENAPEGVERLIPQDAPDEERDRMYVTAAMRLSGGGDTRARDVAGKIKDAGIRAQTHEYVDFELARHARVKGDIGAALERATSDNLAPLKRVWLMTEAGRALTKDDPARAVQTLEDAAAQARRIEPGDADRPRALVAVATRLFDLDRGRVWVLLGEVVKSANSAEEFTGRDARLVSRIVGENFSTTSERNVPECDLAGLFARLAAEDLNRAVEFARAFAAESPRAAASLAAARAVLDRKK